MDNAHNNQAPKCTAVKRQLGGFMAGGVAQVDVTDIGLHGAVNSASKSVNMMSNSINHMTVVHVSQATKQVSNHFLYKNNVKIWNYRNMMCICVTPLKNKYKISNLVRMTSFRNAIIRYTQEYRHSRVKRLESQIILTSLKTLLKQDSQNQLT